MEPQPGAFYDEEEELSPINVDEAFPPLEPELNLDEVRQLQMIRDAMGLKPEVVYYPCCANDSSPSVAFSESKVIYCDNRHFVVDGLVAAGFDAHCESALEFNPGPADVLIMFNPEVEPEFPTQFVRMGGVVICNDFHHTAIRIKNLENFELIGVVNNAQATASLETEDLEGYLHPVENDAEWKVALASAGSISFQDALDTVVALGEDASNVLESYGRLVGRAKAEQAELSNKFPTLHFPLALVQNGQSYVFNEKLPYKKGFTDDYYVFRRKN